MNTQKRSIESLFHNRNQLMAYIISVYNISFLFDLISETVLAFRPPHRHAGGEEELRSWNEPIASFRSRCTNKHQISYFFLSLSFFFFFLLLLAISKHVREKKPQLDLFLLALPGGTSSEGDWKTINAEDENTWWFIFSTLLSRKGLDRRVCVEGILSAIAVLVS